MSTHFKVYRGLSLNAVLAMAYSQGQKNMVRGMERGQRVYIGNMRWAVRMAPRHVVPSNTYKRFDVEQY